MNKILSIALLMIVMQSITAINTNKIDKAIEDSSVIKLKSALSRFEREEMAPQDRMKYLKEFAQAAADLIELREESYSLVGNWRDIAKTASGGAFALLGSFVAFNGMNFGVNPWGEGHDGWDEEGEARGGRLVRPGRFIKSWPWAAGGLAVLTGGCYLLYKGLTCSAQKAQIAQAHAIEELLQEMVDSKSASDRNNASKAERV